MHQIVCRLGLRPRPHWGSLQRSLRPLAGLGGGVPVKREGGREGKRRDGRGGRGREGRESRNALIQSWQAYSKRSFQILLLRRRKQCIPWRDALPVWFYRYKCTAGVPKNICCVTPKAKNYKTGRWFELKKKQYSKAAHFGFPGPWVLWIAGSVGANVGQRRS